MVPGISGDPGKNLTRTINCGKVAGLGAAGWNPACGAPLTCYEVLPGRGNVQTPAFATQTKTGNTWSKPTAWCPNDQQPAVTLAAVREQALRLLPHVAIGSAWTTTALVNAQVILWADSSARRTLPTVTIVGQAVALRLDQPQARWTFGDDSTDAPAPGELGRPYDGRDDPCRTAQCPDYYGHTYRQTGPMTITLTLTWHVQYRIAGGAWTALDQPITGPSSAHDLTVKQARGVLIPDPH